MDEEKVYGKLTTNKIRIEPNTSSVRRDIIDPNPSQVHTSATFSKGKAFVWVSHVLCLPPGGRGTTKWWKEPARLYLALALS